MINGIDVSHHNDVDWKQIQALSLTQNIYFAFIKASEGATFPDQKFTTNRLGTTQAGLLCGAYHFFLPSVDPIQQAKLFVNQVESLREGELPPVVDIEWTQIKTKNGTVKRAELWKAISASERIDKIKGFLLEIEKHLGTKPIIYTALAFWNEFIAGPNKASDYSFFIDYPLWIVNLKGALNVPKPWTVATFIQNAFGELAPKNASAFEKLDHDYFNGRLRGLLAFASKGKVFEKKSPVSAIVRDFQQALKNLGFYSKELDGDFGKSTEQAVRDFQKSIGLPETGKVDAATWKLLLV